MQQVFLATITVHCALTYLLWKGTQTKTNEEVSKLKAKCASEAFAIRAIQKHTSGPCRGDRGGGGVRKRTAQGRFGGAGGPYLLAPGALGGGGGGGGGTLQYC